MLRLGNIHTGKEIHVQTHRGGQLVFWGPCELPTKHGLCLPCRLQPPERQALLRHNHRPQDHLVGEEPLGSKARGSLRTSIM